MTLASIVIAGLASLGLSYRQQHLYETDQSSQLDRLISLARQAVPQLRCRTETTYSLARLAQLMHVDLADRLLMDEPSQWLIERYSAHHFRLTGSNLEPSQMAQLAVKGATLTADVSRLPLGHPTLLKHKGRDQFLKSQYHDNPCPESP